MGNNSNGKVKRQKVSKACVFCQRSHMSCDDKRPCERCIKRNIPHLCRDKDSVGDDSNNTTGQMPSESHIGPSASISPSPVIPQQPQQPQQQQQQPPPPPTIPTVLTPPAMAASQSLPTTLDTNKANADVLTLFGTDAASNEFSALTEFLESLQRSHNPSSTSIAQLVEGATQTERFLLTAADPSDGTSEDKLRQIINAKYEAGILKPYNYVAGYSRMQRFMEGKFSRLSITRIGEMLNSFRPTFRSIAQALTDIDLLLVEEGFERLLLDYDSVFNAFGVPACLWRRTGEIYKANREFADLVGVPLARLHDGRVCIYELMTESSTVNYWEKYGEIAFDASQKAVLTTCVLQTTAPSSSPSTNDKASKEFPAASTTRCCFSFTLRRDKYKIPLAIVGNFMPIKKQQQLK